MRMSCLIVLMLYLVLASCADSEVVEPTPFKIVDAPTPSMPSEPLRALSITQLVAGANHTCAIEGGALYCWGQGAGLPSQAPRLVPGLESQVSAVAAGASHTCAIRAGQLYCWGDHTRGQLGVGQAVSSLDSPAPVTGMSDVSAVAAGPTHTCAVQEGQLYCWGDNTTGQLGDPTRSSDRADSPALVPGLRQVTSLGAGRGYTCAVTAPDTSCLGGSPCTPLRCWGDRRVWQPNPQDSPQIVRSPQLVKRYRDVTVHVGQSHMCLIVSSGLSCQGDDTRGQLGTGSFMGGSDFGPLPVGGFERGTRVVAVGGQHTCASLVGSLACWGANDSGQLGVRGEDRDQPHGVERLSAVTIRHVAAGDAHTCAADDSALWCWGDNRAGQLGVTTPLATSSPVQIALP